MKIRQLGRHEISELWSIDRSEVIERMYSYEGNELVIRNQRHDVEGWPPGEPERDGVLLLDCFDRGGSFVGAFQGDRLVGAMVLESRFIGCDKERLQLKFLHVGREHRQHGLGRVLFELAVERARECGARRLYVSATPSENTVRFYLRRGCFVTDEIDAELFELEPDDIHLECDV